jgi:hypothetical protein
MPEPPGPTRRAGSLIAASIASAGMTRVLSYQVAAAGSAAAAPRLRMSF